MSENALRAENFVEVDRAFQDVGSVVLQPGSTVLPSRPSQKFIIMALIVAGLVLSLLWSAFLFACLVYLLISLF
jgi:energy-converting hydrogenase Eha subunit C